MNSGTKTTTELLAELNVTTPWRLVTGSLGVYASSNKTWLLKMSRISYGILVFITKLRSITTRSLSRAYSMQLYMHDGGITFHLFCSTLPRIKY
jgi:hypothetical protein